MTCLIDESGTYYETLTELTDQDVGSLPAGTLVVQQRPDYFYNWNKETSDWDYDGEVHFEKESESVRRERSRALSELDELVSNPLRFASYTVQTKADLAEYRQALLDVPQQTGFPFEVVWPTKP